MSTFLSRMVSISIIILLSLTFIFVHASAFAGNLEPGDKIFILVEYTKDDRSFTPPVIGQLEYSGVSIDIVRIFEGPLTGSVYVQAQVYILTEKKVQEEGVLYISGKDQHGTIVAGTIDYRDESNPKINLFMEEGYAITNISELGKKWQIKHIPNITLGE